VSLGGIHYRVDLWSSGDARNRAGIQVSAQRHSGEREKEKGHSVA